jgi:methylenetetrahydrofolate--tRNA-(uracil-5-)-methyltransferase
MPKQDLIIIGGGLAGSEAAWQAAQRGLRVHLYEMRPFLSTGAHVSNFLAELVCSNSLGSTQTDRPSGVLKSELQRLDSLLLKCAIETGIPAGSALAVDREGFAMLVTDKISNHPNIKLIREEIIEIPLSPTIIASGPLTSANLSRQIAALSGEEHLFFFDAISPIVTRDSINMDIAYPGSRYGNGTLLEGDYINCPFTEEQYDAFVNAISTAERIELREFERELEGGVKTGLHHFFEGCLPAEIIATRGRQSLAFGPMRPVGLTDPRTGRWPHAVIQLRQDNLMGNMYNIVGFQTNLKFSEQKRVFHMIPGLENAEFARYGQMHRNTFIASPKLLLPTLQFHNRTDLLFGGQITGVEGYLGNIGTGLLAGINAAQVIQGKEPLVLPTTTMLGALCHYVTHADMADFQPMKANFGLFPVLEGPHKGKIERAKAHARRASEDMDTYLNQTEYGI